MKPTMLLEPGIKIGEFVLDSRLGFGSSGEVWKAFVDERPLAIKFMNLALIESDRVDLHRRRMEREVEAMLRLSHPHIPELYSYDLDFERPYLAMEFISGISYDRLVATRDMLRVPIRRRLEVLAILADALQAAHDQGIIHRDIKPGNMKGIAKPYLLDFSIAVEIIDVEHTRFDIGTAIYMPPEDGPPDHLGDNYSFAVAAYEVLFCEHPIFSRDDKMRDHLHAVTRFTAYNRMVSDDWRKPSSVMLHELPPDLQGANLDEMDKIFKSAMGERDQRYTDLAQFVSDLERTILIPENETFLDMQPLPVDESIPDEVLLDSNFTFIEAGRDEPPKEDFVEIIGGRTDVGEEEKPSRVPLFIGAGVAVLVVLAIAAVLTTFLQG